MIRRAATDVSAASADERVSTDPSGGDGVDTAGVPRPASPRVTEESSDVDFGDNDLTDVIQEAIRNRESLLAAAAGHARSDTDLARLVGLYWRLVPDEELVGRTADQLYDVTCRHRQLAAQRLAGEPKIELSNPAPEGHTRLQIVTDDMPFLVDSVTATLAAKGLEIHLMVHPQVVVRREPLGRLIEIRPDVEADDAGSRDTVESWMTFEIDRQQDETALGELRADLQRVLTDVREVAEDWPRMLVRVKELCAELRSARLPVPDSDLTDAIDLLSWLADDHFTFLGYREYRISERDGEQVLAAVGGTGLGILRADQQQVRHLSSMAPEAYEKALEKRLLIITKANSRATVHRQAYLDYIGFKTFDADGNVVGEKRFLGLFTSAAYVQSVRDLPVVRRKVAAVLRRSGLSPRSHSGKDLMQILETYPRDELFQASTDELFRTVMGVLRLAGRRQLRLFLRRDAYGRFISCLVYLPRDRFSTRNRLRIQDILLKRLNGVGLDYSTRVTEGQLARIHVTVRTDPAAPPSDVDVEAIQHELADATRLWEDDFRLLLDRKLGDEQARYLYDRYAEALGQTYKDEHNPHEASKDLAKLELLDEPGELAMHLYRRRKNDDDLRFKVFRLGEPMMLSALLPVLHSLGVRVADERPFEIRRDDGTVYLYDFGLRPPADALDMGTVRAKVENAFSAAWRGESEVDGFNQLVLRAGLTWRQIVVLRAYAKYLRQAGTVFSQDYIQDTFIAYPGIATLLVALFETRFDPRVRLDHRARIQHAEQLVEAISEQLDDVASLEADRILRSFLTMVQATLRTSFFQRGRDGRPKQYVAFKLDPQRIDTLPKPRPRYEIFVYSPRFEGVHLRFGATARGGLRWSDRREDFRTEVLGLVKAQMVKNAVIVPVGAKGGFVLKQAPPASDREAFQAEGVACYRAFISALLDVTDNITPDGAVVPPADVVRHDGDDTYLVVAADKGTATFSDIANGIAVERGFWLGDAFASGGSVGYDHKKMGITARGAWESVKHHFRELGVDCQTEEFTAVGIGDMSGDVFGNGMLCSEHTRLVAAFDHRHIFLDPDPDPAVSYAERRRMFDLPRSSWADYDTSTVSAGGGVWPRTAKAVPISPQVRAALGLADDVTTLSPPELIRAILTAPVDLLWNGGIGTYVKASTESNLDAGDKSNDPVRVNGKQLRCKVVGEGGNLGFTQLGRVEFARAGGRINTDFIDNSAGVDTSDHEVNIKILLNRATATGELSEQDRRDLLFGMTEEIAGHVLRHNYNQNVALGCARAQARSLLPVHRRMIASMERAGTLDRALEGLPADEELEARGAAGAGLTSPEFSVILAYVKIALEAEILDSALPDETWTRDVLVDYFPSALRAGYAERMPDHPLHREIVTTVMVNEAVNRGGSSFVYRAVEETGATVPDVLRAYVIARDVFGLTELWRDIEALDNRVPTAAQTAALLRTRRGLDRAVRWLLQNRRSPLAVADEVARFGAVRGLLPRVGELYRGAEREAYRTHVRQLVEAGIPDELADRASRVLWGFGLLDVVEVAHTTEREPAEVAEVYYAMSARFRADEVLDRISRLPREDRWQTQARQALRYDLYAALAALSAEALVATDGDLSGEERVEAWAAKNTTSIGRALAAIDEFESSPADLAALSVLLRQIRTAVRTSALPV